MPKGIQTREGQNCYDRAGRDLIIATFQQKSGYHLITRQLGGQAKIGTEHEPYTTALDLHT